MHHGTQIVTPFFSQQVSRPWLCMHFCPFLSRECHVPCVLSVPYWNWIILKGSLSKPPTKNWCTYGRCRTSHHNAVPLSQINKVYSIF
jgi:hypothetical protein